MKLLRDSLRRTSTKAFALLLAGCGVYFFVGNFRHSSDDSLQRLDSFPSNLGSVQENLQGIRLRRRFSKGADFVVSNGLLDHTNAHRLEGDPTVRAMSRKIPYHPFDILAVVSIQSQISFDSSDELVAATKSRSLEYALYSRTASSFYRPFDARLMSERPFTRVGLIGFFGLDFTPVVDSDLELGVWLRRVESVHDEPLLGDIKPNFSLPLLRLNDLSGKTLPLPPAEVSCGLLSNSRGEATWLFGTFTDELCQIHSNGAEGPALNSGVKFDSMDKTRAQFGVRLEFGEFFLTPTNVVPPTESNLGIGWINLFIEASPLAN